MDLQNKYNKIYSSKAKNQPENYFNLEWRMKNLLWRHKKLLRTYDVSNKRILDFGCSDGVFSIALADKKAAVCGYDISSEAIHQAQKLNSNKDNPFFTSNPPQDNYFDIIFLNEVLEHIENINSFLSGLIKYLAAGGDRLIIGTVPVNKYFNAPDHKHYFNYNSLLKTLEPFGEVKITKYYRKRYRNFLPYNQKSAAVFIFKITA